MLVQLTPKQKRIYDFLSGTIRDKGYARGPRTVPAAEFFPGHVWVGGRLQCHILQDDEIISEIEIPFRSAPRGART